MLDFGPAKLTGDEGSSLGETLVRTVAAPLSMAGQVVGTVPYLAPEQVRGADASYRRALELDPGNSSALRSAAGLARTLDRMHEFALHAAGRLAEAEEALAEAIQETEPVFEWLERAYAQRDGGLAD